LQDLRAFELHDSQGVLLEPIDDQAAAPSSQRIDYSTDIYSLGSFS
jgi:hypothetical protein